MLHCKPTDLRPVISSIEVPVSVIVFLDAFALIAVWNYHCLKALSIGIDIFGFFFGDHPCFLIFHRLVLLRLQMNLSVPMLL